MTLTGCDDLTLAVGQTITCNGANLYNRQTTGWSTWHREDLNRPDFEGTNGASLATLGYLVNAAQGVLPTIDEAQAFIGSASGHFRSIADEAADNPDCSAREGAFQGGTHESDIQFEPNGVGVNLTAGYVGYALRFHRNTNWPNNVQKHIEVPKANYYWQPANGGAPRGRNPQTFILFNTAVGRNEASHTFSPDGGPILDDRWYYIQIQVQEDVADDLQGHSQRRDCAQPFTGGKRLRGKSHHHGVHQRLQRVPGRRLFLGR